jgi:hypothetical protein
VTGGPQVAFRVLLTAAALGWAALIVLAPRWDAASPHDRYYGVRSTVATVVRLAGAQVCHQRPERSFHLRGHALAVCGRCTGLYLSGALGLLAVASRRPRRGPSASMYGGVWWPSRLDVRAGWLVLSALPTMITWSAEVAGAWNPGTPLRALAALPLGLTAGWLLGRALDGDAVDL